jgi:hypothetical protein
VDIARALCDSATVTARDAGFACACPAYTELPIGELTIGAFQPGHFSGRGRDEVVVATGGCETGAGSNQTYGGRALVRREAGIWRRVFYAAGALGDCTSLPSRQERSRLVCHRTGGHMGATFDELSLVAFDDANGETKEARSTILHLRSLSERTPTSPGAEYRLELTRYAITGRDAYMAGDERALTINAVVRSRIACAGASTCGGLTPGTVDFQLRFGFDGTTFRLSPSSDDAFRKMKAREKD